MALMTVDLLTENNDWQTHPLIYRVTFTPSAANDTAIRFIELPAMHGAYRTIWTTLAVPDAYTSDDIPNIQLWGRVSDAVRTSIVTLLTSASTKQTTGVTADYHYFESRLNVGGATTALPLGYPCYLRAQYTASKDAGRNDTLVATITAAGI